MAWFAGRRGRGNGGRSHWPPALTQCALDVAGSGPTTWRGSRTAIGSPTVAPPAIASEVLEHRAPALSDCSHSASLTTTTKKNNRQWTFEQYFRQLMLTIFPALYSIWVPLRRCSSVGCCPIACSVAKKKKINEMSLNVRASCEMKRLIRNGKLADCGARWGPVESVCRWQSADCGSNPWKRHKNHLQLVVWM